MNGLVSHSESRRVSTLTEELPALLRGRAYRSRGEQPAPGLETAAVERKLIDQPVEQALSKYS
jgi:hypothetical protein